MCVECLSVLLQNLGPEELAEATGAVRRAREELGLALDEISFCGTVITIGTGEMFAACRQFYKGIMHLDECEQSDSEVCCLVVCLLEISMFVQATFQIAQSVYLKLKAAAVAQRGAEVCLLSGDVSAVAQALQAANIDLITVSAEHVSCTDPAGTIVTVHAAASPPQLLQSKIQSCQRSGRG